ncbi:MAG: cytochrome c [Steroidobacteraceae bacterium]
MSSRTPTSKIAALGGALLLAALVAAPTARAQAQDNRNAQAIKYRQSAYTVLVAQFGVMGAMVQGKIPFDAKTFQTRAQRSAFMAQILPELFPAGSDSGAPTKAKPEIWQQTAEFQKLMKDVQDKLAALDKAAAGGTLESVKPAFQAASQACKACHEKYKND